jgi:hypothetical protein
MDARSKLIDVAAFLDRIDRHGRAADYRVAALKRALAEVAEEVPGRACRVLESFSDPTAEPVAAATEQGASGAYRGGEPVASALRRWEGEGGRPA